MITCPQCGRENQNNYKFCLACGALLRGADSPTPLAADPPPARVPLSHTVACSYCGTTFTWTEEAKCPDCGAPVEEPSQAQAE